MRNLYPLVLMFLLVASCTTTPKNSEDHSVLVEDLTTFDYCSFVVTENDFQPTFKKTDMDKDDLSVFFNAGIKIARMSSPDACNEDFLDGQKMFSLKVSNLKSEYKKQWPTPSSENKDTRTVQKTILEMAIQDQSTRHAWVYFRTLNQNDPSIQWAKKLSAYSMFDVDNKNLPILKQILLEIGWPKKSTHGETTGFLTWSLLQHADADVAFQEQLLVKLGQLVNEDEVRKQSYALLVDRVSINKNEAQIYGSQSTGECLEGEPVMQPIQDIKNVDIRRKSMDLPPLHVYKKKLANTVCVKYK